jgi:RND superfamily putative drug exporter
MATLLYRLGRFATHRRWAVLGIWLALLLGLGGAAAAFSGTMTSSFTIPGTPAQAALDQLNEKLPGAGDATGRIVFAAPEGRTLTEPEYQQAIGTVISQAKELPGVTNVIDPQTGQTVSPDRRVAFAQAFFAGQITEIPETTQSELAKIADANEVDGLQIELGGGAVAQAPAIGSTEGIGVVVAMIVLLITFGSIVAAGLPMITALIGVGTGMAGILWASSVIEMSNTAPILALMLGLAVGIDYALFIVSRHRSQVRAGMPVRESIARANGTAGTAVVFAGLTVLIALAGLSVVGIPFLTVMGLAAAATVGIAVLIAITLLPALLGFAGDRVLRKKDRPAAAALREQSTGTIGVIDHAHSPNKWIRMITKRPAVVLASGVIALAVVALPTLSLYLGLPDDGTASPDSTNRQAYDLISESFGPGLNGPLLVTVAVDDPAKMASALPATAQAIQGSSSDVMLAVPGQVSADGTFGTITVIPKSGPSEEATQQLVHDLRDQAPALGAQVGGTLAVTGVTAAAIDVSDKLAEALPIYLLIVVGLALVLLLLIFRSIVVPVVAAAGFLLSVGVSFGAVVAVYQWGWLGGLFGVDTPAPIISFLPILLIGVLFGLAMDYQVFMVTGMREAYVHGADAKRAVISGWTAGSRVVTAAGIIMASVFAGFILAPDTIIASIGFALAIGVLVDAFVVRMTLTPAIMTLLGKSAWFLPRWLDKVLPNVDIEGEKLLASLEAESRQPAVVGAGSNGAASNGAASDSVTSNRASGSGGAVPNGAVPSGAVPSGAVSSGAVSNGAVPNGAVPNGAVPNGAVPSPAVPNGAVTGGAPADGEAAAGPGGRVSDSAAPTGRHSARAAHGRDGDGRAIVEQALQSAAATGEGRHRS